MFSAAAGPSSAPVADDEDSEEDQEREMRKCNVESAVSRTTFKTLWL